MVELDTDALKAVAELNGKADRLPQAIENGVQRVAERYQQQKVKNIGRTDARAIPLSGTGRPLWERTGALLQGQTILKDGQFERTVATIGPASEPITDFPQGYEQKLATLPVSKDGVNRQNAAGPDAEKTITPQVPDLFKQEVLNELDR
jgi:hypothetical protein